jgi:hypothetical protein
MAGGAEAPRWPHIPVGQQEPATPPPPKRTAPSLEAPSLTNSHTAPSLEAPFVNKPANFSVSCSPGARHAPRLRGVVCPCSLLSCVRRGALPAASEESWQNMPSQQDPGVPRLVVPAPRCGCGARCGSCSVLGAAARSQEAGPTLPLSDLGVLCLSRKTLPSRARRKRA